MQSMLSNLITFPSLSVISAAYRFSEIAILHCAHMSVTSISAGRGNRFPQPVASSRRQIKRVLMDVPQVDIFKRRLHGGNAGNLRPGFFESSQDTVPLLRRGGNRHAFGGAADAATARRSRRSNKPVSHVANLCSQQRLSVQFIAQRHDALHNPQSPADQNGDAIGQKIDIRKDVRRENNRPFQVFERPEEATETGRSFRIQAGCGFVEQENRSIRQDGYRNSEALHHSTGEFAYHAVRCVTESTLLKRCFDAPRRKFAQAAIEFQYFARGHLFGKSDALREITDRSPKVRTLAFKVDAVDADLARGGQCQPRQAFERGRFPASVRSQKPKGLARANLERDVIERLHGSEPLPKTAHLDHRFRPFHMTTAAMTTIDAGTPAHAAELLCIFMLSGIFMPKSTGFIK